MVNLDMGASAGSYTAYVELFMNIITGLVVVGAIFRSTYIGLSFLSNEQTLEDLLKKLTKIICAAILCGGIPQLINLIARAYGWT